MVRDEITKGKAQLTEHAAGEHGVEHGARTEAVGALEQAQIVVGPVQDQVVPVKNLEQRLQVETGQRIDENVFAREADLDQAEFLRIGVEAVGLRVDGDPGGLGKLWENGGELRFGIDHGAF